MIVTTIDVNKLYLSHINGHYRLAHGILRSGSTISYLLRELSNTKIFYKCLLNVTNIIGHVAFIKNASEHVVPAG